MMIFQPPTNEIVKYSGQKYLIWYIQNMDFLQFKDLIQQTGYLILTLIQTINDIL